MKLLIQRMLVSTAIAIVSLASVGNAMAANPHPKARASTAQAAKPHLKARMSTAQTPYRYQGWVDAAAAPSYPNYSSNASPAPYSSRGYDVAAREPYSQWGDGYPFAGPGFDVRQYVMAALARAAASHHGGKASGSGSYENGSPPTDDAAAAAAGWAIEQSANDTTAAAMQEEDQSLQELDQSTSAMEQQDNQ
jgi:hypothetical protein